MVNTQNTGFTSWSADQMLASVEWGDQWGVQLVRATIYGGGKRLAAG